MNTALLVAGIAFSALAQIVIKYSARFDAWGGQWLALTITGAAMYSASFLAYSFLLRKEDLSRLSPIMASAVALIVVLAGMVFFGEQLTPRRGIGIALGIVAIAMLAK